MTKTYVGDIGTSIELDTGVSLATATLLQIEAKKPDGTEVMWASTAINTSVVRRLTQAGDLDQAGLWRLQAVVTTPAGTWRGETAKLKVYPEFR